MQNTSSYLDELCHALPTVLVKLYFSYLPHSPLQHLTPAGGAFYASMLGKMCTFVLGVGYEKTALNQLNPHLELSLSRLQFSVNAGSQLLIF